MSFKLAMYAGVLAFMAFAVWLDLRRGERLWAAVVALLALLIVASWWLPEP